MLLLARRMGRRVRNLIIIGQASVFDFAIALAEARIKDT